MALNVRLSPDDEHLLEITAKRLGRSKSDLARQAVQELCKKLVQEERSSYSIGMDLFDAGELSAPPSDPTKKQIWEKLHAKHRKLG